MDVQKIVADYLESEDFDTLIEFGSREDGLAEIAEFPDFAASPTLELVEGTYYFDIEEESLLINDMLELATDNLGFRTRWVWDDPSSLYIDGDDVEPDNEEQVAEAHLLVETAAKFYNEVLRIARESVRT